MAASIRTQRIAEQIQVEISSLLMKGLKDPRIGFVTITGVEVSPDLSHAIIYFGSHGSESEKLQSLEGLQNAVGFIRKTLGKSLRLKNIPQLEFRYDQSLDEGARIERLLQEVRRQEGWDDPSRVRGSAEDIAQALLNGSRFLVTSHTNPDGDAVASLLAMGHLLRTLKKEVVLYNPDPVPANFRFLPGSEGIKAKPDDGAYDTTIILDCSELNRIGPLPSKDLYGKLIGIDHHLTVKPLGEISYLDPKASSIGEMIERVLTHLPIEIDLPLASCIYCSILSDTGSFRYSNTTPATLMAAAKMLSIGVSPWETALKVYESQPLQRLQLLARVLKTLELDPRGLYGSILVTQKDLQETQATIDMLDGFINYPRGIDGVEVAIQFREIESDRYKVSFRSRGRIDVAAVAENFGGGGHRNAAGCSLNGSLESVRQRIYQTVEQVLDE